MDDILKHAFEKGFDGRKRTTVGFCAGVRHAEFMADATRKAAFNRALASWKCAVGVNFVTNENNESILCLEFCPKVLVASIIKIIAVTVIFILCL